MVVPLVQLPAPLAPLTEALETSPTSAPTTFLIVALWKLPSSVIGHSTVTSDAMSLRLLQTTRTLDSLVLSLLALAAWTPRARMKAVMVAIGKSFLGMVGPLLDGQR